MKQFFWSVMMEKEGYASNLDDKVKRFRCKAHHYEGMKRTYWYGAMSEDAVQRSRWIFYEVVSLNK